MKVVILMDGLFFIDKPKGITSRDVVNTVIRKTETRKVGHTGTLDPLATGVLIVCVGKATKLVDILTATEKVYEAEICLGIETDTLDVEGIVLKEECVTLSEEKIDDVLKNMVGEYEQEVPKYSAVKVNGKKLYEYARENKEVSLPTRVVTIFEIERISPLRNENGKVYFSIRTKVSKGTYIRSLIRDIAIKLNTIGIMNNLRRVRQGNFTIDMCKNLDDIYLADLHPLADVLSDVYQVVVDDVLKKEVLNGKILKNTYNQDRILFKDREGALLALYQIYEKDDTKIKPYIMIGGIK